MLITGPWQEASSNYTCLFDQVAVPASLIQPGVLRCYCPGKTGLTGLAWPDTPLVSFHHGPLKTQSIYQGYQSFSFRLGL